jgi:hypothetical protein
MTATAAAYRAPYVSEILKETDGTINDCAVSTGIMLAGDWTLGEALTRPDGKPKDVLFLREWTRKQLGPGAQDGGLTLHDMNDLLQVLDPDLPPLPRYNGQELRKGQSAAGANLRLTFDELKGMLQSGYSAALCGNPAGVKDPDSPFRTKQGNDDYPHVVRLTDGTKSGCRLFDPLTRKGRDWPGERVSWDEVRQFTEAKKPGTNDRQFGSTSAVACAVIKVGDETEAARISRKALVAAAKANQRLADQKAQTTLATEERDQARRELKTAQETATLLQQANERIAAERDLAQQAADELRTALTATDAALTACRNATPPDCTMQVAQAVAAEHARIVAILEQEGPALFADLVGRIR